MPRVTPDHPLLQHIPDSNAELRYPEVGWQTPTIFHSSINDPADQLMFADHLIEWFEMVCPAVHLFPWQKLALRMALADDYGQWLHSEVCLIVPRQNGKNIVLHALEIIHLYYLKTETIQHTSHHMNTTRKSWRELKRFIEKSPYLLSKTANFTKSPQLSIETVFDTTLYYSARGNGAGRGESPQVLIYDEAMILAEETTADMSPSVSAQPNSQIWYTSSTGYADSEVLKKLHDRGLDGDPEDDLLLLEWSADLDRYEWNTLEAAAQSNPSLGYLQSWRKMRKDSRSMPEAAYQRERLGCWHEAAGLAVISPELWDATTYIKSPDLARKYWRNAELLDSNPVVKRALALDVDRERRSYLAGAAQLRDGRIVVEIIESSDGTAWVQDSIARFKTHPDASKFVSPIALDSGQAAGSLIDVLERGGIPVRPAKYADVVLGAQSFYDALTHRDADGDADPQIFHPENHELTDSALTVVKRYRSNSSAWTWGAGSEVPDSPMRAVTLAFWALTEPYENPNQKQKRRRTAPVFY